MLLIVISTKEKSHQEILIMRFLLCRNDKIEKIKNELQIIPR